MNSLVSYYKTRIKRDYKHKPLDFYKRKVYRERANFYS